VDQLNPIAEKPDYIQNLFTMMKLVSGADVLQNLKQISIIVLTGNCIIRYGDMKKQLAEDMVNFIQPIREKAADLLNNQELDTESSNKEPKGQI
jgi:tryptophanyl-tRNA synthetase